MAVCEIPLAAASFLKSVSQASKLPVPQDAASAGVPVSRATLTANALGRERIIIGVSAPEINSMVNDNDRTRQKVRGHFGVGRKAAVSCETITIRPDAKTKNRSWPCRELS